MSYEAFRLMIQGWASSGYLPEALAYGFVVSALLAGLIIGPVLGGLATGGAAAYGAEKLYEESRLQQFSRHLGRQAGHRGIGAVGPFVALVRFYQRRHDLGRGARGVVRGEEHQGFSSRM